MLKLPEKLKPYSGILYFMVLLVTCHLFWKFTVIGDESGDAVIFFGMNISAPFVFMARHVAEVTHSILQFLGYHTTLYENNVIRHNESLHSVLIIWGCTGIKQAYIFFCIIAFYRGALEHKLWYIPMGLLFIYLFNIFRVTFITAIIDKHHEQFNLWHEYILKYLFYIMIFLLWVIWDEKFCKKGAINNETNVERRKR